MSIDQLSKHFLYQKKVLVIGLGVSGKSAARFLLKRGAHVLGVDSNQTTVEGENSEITQLRLQGLNVAYDSLPLNLAQFECVVISPGISTSHPYYQKAVELKIDIIGEIELACREMSQKCVAITGTNGKTTVTTLIEHVLQKAGIKAMAFGNIGLPLTMAIDDPNLSNIEVFILELSSFQLETLESQFIDAAILLNITPDHLDRYASMEKYATAKINIQNNVKNNGKFFAAENVVEDFRHLFNLTKTSIYGYNPFSHAYTDLKKIYINNQDVLTLPSPYQGKKSHDSENIMAAFLLCRELGVEEDQFLKGLETFKKPSHRIEFVRSFKDVNYYDDSKGTNIDAVIRAVESFDHKIVLIAGGVDKGFPYISWNAAFNGKVKAICAIGESAGKIRDELGHAIPVILFNSLGEATHHASQIAQLGDTVLLSPGCASYDMFKDYVHRGKEFQRIVNSL